MSEESTSAPEWTPAEDEEEVNEDFLYHFYQGGELLRQGKLEQARMHMEAASDLRPDNSKCQNLLGLIYFKQGLFERSIDIYKNLVEKVSGEETLRVNLATVLIRAGRLEEAETELERALQLRPDYDKAHKTLAVVLARKGAVEQAREHLAAAGVDEEPGPVAEAAAGDEIDPGEEAVEPEWSMVDSQPPAQAEEAVPAAGTMVIDDSVRGAPEDEAPAPDEVQYRVEGDCLVVWQAGISFARLERLVWITGDLSFSESRKRFSGKETKYQFGKGARAMVMIEGQGKLCFAGGGDTYQVVSQGVDPGFFVEERVFAFSGASSWENGRLQSGSDSEVSVFHLRGPAQIVLTRSEKLMRRVVHTGEKFLVRVASLVGWSGDLVPHLVEADKPLPAESWVELSGQGSVIYTL